jgi:hypothetical protein
MRRLGIASFVIGAVLVAFFGVLIVRNLPSTPKPIEGGLVHLSRDGLTLWASEDHVPAECEVKGPDGSDVPLVSDESTSLQINDGEWFSVARSAKAVPPGDYAINCVAVGFTADTVDVTFSAAPRMSVLIFVLAILGAVFSLMGSLALGSVFLTAASRRRRRDSVRGGPPPGYPQAPGYPQPPGYPQYGPGGQQGPQYGGSNFPGYPPPSTYRPGPNPDRPQDRPQDRLQDGPEGG